jgi:hypothetical protein
MWIIDLIDNDGVYWVVVLIAAGILYRKQRRKQKRT